MISDQTRVRYADDSISLTLWFDEKGNILAFEIIFGLLVDEWAFLYHRKGSERYCRVDQGENRIGRPQKQILTGNSTLPAERVIEFEKSSQCIFVKHREFVLNILKKSNVQ